MSKLSFVALSLQTTHLDPASVSKASYVKLVDGNITRQDDLPIIPPTGRKKVADEQSEGSLTQWNEALEQMGMMIGKLPVVSYYRDADKEIFQAASRQLNIQPPTLHWLDCRELARKLLPDLSDVQLSTVLKTLDLYDEFADSSAVEQTAQIVISLAQRHNANTVEELWNELYDQPDDLLGLDSTFEGSANSGSSANDEEIIEGPLAAEVLPFAAASSGISTQDKERRETAPLQTNDEVLSAKAAVDEPADPLTKTEEPAAEVVDDSAPRQEIGVDEDESPTPTPAPLPGELPVFLQEHTRDEPVAPVEESSDTTGAQDFDPELDGTTAVTPSTLTDTDEAAAGTGISGDQPDELVTLPEPMHQAPYDDVAEVKDSGSPPTQLPEEVSSEHLDETVATTPNEPAAEDHSGLDELDEPAFLTDPVHEEVPDQDSETVEATESELDASGVAGVEPVHAPNLINFNPATSAAKNEAFSTPISSPIGNVPPPHSEAAVSAKQLDVQAIRVEELPRVEEAPRTSSTTNQIFGFVGLFVFGVLSIIGVVLIVMAVMLFFTENSLMLETKIAGVILTVAITLLSLLMTNVSYRSFRNK